MVAARLQSTAYANRVIRCLQSKLYTNELISANRLREMSGTLASGAG